MELMIDPKKNINWINAVKALSIMRVFFVHSAIFCCYELGKIGSFIFPFYVNIIFFVSGYLVFRKQLGGPAIEESAKYYITHSGKTLFRNIIYRIFFPVLIFSFLEFFPKYIIRGKDMQMTAFLWETVGGRTYWFTCALLVAELMFLLLFFTRRRNIWFYWTISIVMMCIGSYMIDNDVTVFGLDYNPWSLDKGLCAMAFLASGGLYWKYETQVQNVMTKPVVIFMVLVYVVTFAFFDTLVFDMMEISYFSWYPIGCLAAVLLIGVCRYLPPVRFLTFIGQFSIGFYFVSGALPEILSLIVSRQTFLPDWAELLVVWITAIAVAYGVTYFLNRYLPWLFDLRVLWRHKFSVVQS